MQHGGLIFCSPSRSSPIVLSFHAILNIAVFPVIDPFVNVRCRRMGRFYLTGGLDWETRAAAAAPIVASLYSLFHLLTPTKSKMSARRCRHSLSICSKQLTIPFPESPGTEILS
jgi:hypothetical protein